MSIGQIKKKWGRLREGMLESAIIRGKEGVYANGERRGVLPEKNNAAQASQAGRAKGRKKGGRVFN